MRAIVMEGLGTRVSDMGDRQVGNSISVVVGEMPVRASGTGGRTMLGRTVLFVGFGMVMSASSGLAQSECSDLDRAYRQGATISADQGPVRIDGPSGLEVEQTLRLGVPYQTDGRVDFHGYLKPEPVFRVEPVPNGSRMGFFDGHGTYRGGLSSVSDGGVEVVVTRNDQLNVGFFYNGNFFGSDQYFLFLGGESTFYSFDNLDVGNDAVQFPDSAIDRDEVAEECGVAAAIEGVSVTILNGGVQTILSRSITVPSDGHVLVIGTLQAGFSHLMGTVSSYHFGVSETAASLPSGQVLNVQMPKDMPDGIFDFPVTVQRTFPVARGVHTFYLLGEWDNGPDGTIFDKQLSLIYFPTSYGTVNDPADGQGGDPAAGVGVHSRSEQVPAED